MERKDRRQGQMTENEAIEIHIGENINKISTMEEFLRTIPNADDKECRKNISVLTKVNGMLQEIEQYRAIGTIEECREARKRQKLEEDADPVRQIVSIPSTEEAFKSALRRATTTQINEALRRMGGKNGKRARISACFGELRKRRKEQEKALAAYKVIQNYCNNRETCDGCLFEMEDGAPGACLMEYQDVPAKWQELELDEPAANK